MSTGYGRELSTTSSTIRYITGWRVVAEALFRRVTTRRRTIRSVRPNSDADAYGIDLADFIGSTGFQSAVNAIPGIVYAEFKKDDRVADVDTKASIVTETDGTSKILIECGTTLEDSGESFDLTFSVTAAGASDFFARAT